MLQEDVSKMILINKPEEWTSFDVVKKVRGLVKSRYKLNKVKVGHAGTLDPKATGLLVLCIGHKTKQIKMFENLDKKYIGVMKIGCVTDSFDTETKERNFKPYDYLSDKKIHEIFHTFLGDQKQKPPIFSAIKVDGERLYKKARRGERNIKVNDRQIFIHNLEVIELNLPYIKFEVLCSKGTYIRSLVHDIGNKLLCGAYLYQLKRTEVGEFKLENALDIDNITSAL